MRPEGGVEAIEIGSGQTVWTSEFADKPLVVTDGGLLAQREHPEGALILALLQLENGEPLRERRIEMPERVVALIDDDLDRRFEIEAQAVDGGAVVHWTEIFHPVAAVQRLQQDPVVTEGVFRVGFDLEEVQRMELADMAARFADPPPDLSAAERLAQVEGVQFRSVAGEAVLTSDRIADNRTWEKYRWSVYDRDSGVLLGQFDDFQRVSSFEFLAAGATAQDEKTPSIVLQEVAPHTRMMDGQAASVPLSVRAIDLRDGTEIWRRAVRDTTYRGPLPH